MGPSTSAEVGLEGRNVDEVSFLLSSRRTRLSFQRARLVPADWFPYSSTLAVALLVLLLGIFAIISIVARAGPLI